MPAAGRGYARGSESVAPKGLGRGSSGWNSDWKQSSVKRWGWKKLVAKPKTKKFVCACCKTTSLGEPVFIQHLLGRKHFARSGGKGFVGLLPDEEGVVSELSQAGQHKLEKAEAEAAGDSARVKREAVQSVEISHDSASFLNALLSSSAGRAVTADKVEAGAKGSSISNECGPDNFKAHKVKSKKQRVATVPPTVSGAPHLKSTREALPVFAHREAILGAVRKGQIVIVEGETGCGKTTQVAQFIVERAAEEETPCSVICTQPRRISALSVAERVADERGETLGGTVGYAVRLERKASAKTHLLFCTTGILLRRLESDADLEGTTHVVVDEVHERGVESDFLLLALRDLCQRRQDLKVILMSATMDKDLFSRYFGPATASVTVPGRTFPVEDFFVEDVIHATGHKIDPTARWSVGGGKGKGKGKGFEQSAGADEDGAKREDLSEWSVRKNYSAWGAPVQAALQCMDQEQVNYDLLVALLQDKTLENLGKQQELQTKKNKPPVLPRPSGVLVFLSGAKEIETVQKALALTHEFGTEAARDWVLPLHGGLPTEDQKRVFEKPPPGTRKIVLSTNVAETSITIDDVGYVVDTCRMKEMRYDAVRRMSSLEDTVVSRTNARQRRGRAGRVAPGLAVHLGLTRYRHDSLIEDHQPPEVRRVPLEQLVLRIHAAGLHLRDSTGKAAAICARLLEPPKPAFVEKAVEQLVRLGAIEVERGSGRERLTALGEHLAKLPLEARLGKLVLYGAAFGAAAADAALTIAAALTSRNPFLAPLEVREEAGKVKRSFADKLVGGPVGPSDHLAVLAAYREWDQLPHQGDDRMDFCRANFLSIRTLQGMSELKRSLLETLSEAGFVASGLRAHEVRWRGRSPTGAASDGVLLALTGMGDHLPEPCPPVLVAALLCAALFPQVATGRMPIAVKPKQHKIRAQEPKPVGLGEKPKFVVRDLESLKPVKVKIHPGSVSFLELTLSSPYMVFQELVSTTQLYVRDVTPVPPLALVLFGGSLASDTTDDGGGDAVLVVDDWIKLSVPASLKPPLLEARRRLDEFLASWVGVRDGLMLSGTKQDQSGSNLLNAIVQLLNMQQQCAPEPPPQREQKKKRLADFPSALASHGDTAGKKSKWARTAGYPRGHEVVTPPGGRGRGFPAGRGRGDGRGGGRSGRGRGFASKPAG